MGHGHGHSEGHTLQVMPKDSKKIRKIWLTCLYLGIFTAIEFIIAFALPTETYKVTKITLFVLLTIVKCFFIVGEFMHLKYEVKMLVWCIIFPTLFIMWFIGSMIWEGGSVLNYIQEVFGTN